MKRTPLHVLAAALAVIYFLLSFNAFACWIPMYGGVEVAKGSDCSLPQEQAARQYCDAFKTLSVQSAPSALQALDLSAHALVVVEAPALQPLLPLLKGWARAWDPPPPLEDVLALTSVLRL